jgi:hypothetical protein
MFLACSNSIFAETVAQFFPFLINLYFMEVEVELGWIPVQRLLAASIDSCYGDLLKIIKLNYDEEEKREKLLEWVGFQRKRFIKILVLLRFPVEKNIYKVHHFIDQEDLKIETCANALFQIHNQLKAAPLPNLDLFSAIDVLTTGKYRQLPLVLKVTKLFNKD